MTRITMITQVMNKSLPIALPYPKPRFHKSESEAVSKETEDEDDSITEELEFPTHQELEEGDSHMGIISEFIVRMKKNKP